MDLFCLEAVGSLRNLEGTGGRRYGRTNDEEWRMGTFRIRRWKESVLCQDAQWQLVANALKRGSRAAVDIDCCSRRIGVCGWKERCLFHPRECDRGRSTASLLQLRKREDQSSGGYSALSGCGSGHFARREAAFISPNRPTWQQPNAGWELWVTAIRRNPQGRRVDQKIRYLQRGA